MSSRTIQRPIVLIVEDEVLIRMHAAAMIDAAGFDVVEAADAEDAIRILETRSDIAVVFTDIEMPGSMDGFRLAAAVRNRWPPIKILTTSGNVLENDVPVGERFLRKPYSAEQISAQLHELTAA